jgi:hypothetical protein
MGQFGNQPDFATSNIQEITVANGFISDTPSLASKLNGAVIYIGDNSTVGNELKVIPAGVLAPGGGLPTAAQAITFKGLGTGGFLPVTVDYVLATGTTVAELIAAK